MSAWLCCKAILICNLCTNFTPPLVLLHFHSLHVSPLRMYWLLSSGGTSNSNYPSWVSKFLPLLCPQTTYCTLTFVGHQPHPRWQMARWELKASWQQDGRGIGWAEMVAVYMAVATLISNKLTDVSIIGFTNNARVHGALKAGYSCGSLQNEVL
jgi:hypothetical protein